MELIFEEVSVTRGSCDIRVSGSFGRGINLVSGRVGNGKGDYASAGDNRIPEDMLTGDFETPATMNDTWGYKSFDENWKSAASLIRQLVDGGLAAC